MEAPRETASKDPPNALYGITKTELLPIVEAVAGEPVADYRLEHRSLKEGHSGGDKRFCTFRYTTRAGQEGEATLFVKRCVWKGRSEALHYRYLASHGVPTPRVYGTLPHPDGDEVIFLERLARIGFQEGKLAEWRSLLTLMARFNACPVTEEYFPHLHPYEQVGAIDGRWWITGVRANPEDEEIEASLREGGVAEAHLPALLLAARSLFDAIDAQPRGLLHQDFMWDNVGWRGDEMVVFDVHKNAWGPRFADVAPYLGLPDWSDRVAFLDAAEAAVCSRREALTRHYLEEYARFGGETVPVETFREEAGALFWAHKVSNLGWLRERTEARAQEVVEFLRQMSLR
jgi:hypothetical protein